MENLSELLWNVQPGLCLHIAGLIGNTPEVPAEKTVTSDAPTGCGQLPTFVFCNKSPPRDVRNGRTELVFASPLLTNHALTVYDQWLR
jgi:hypothetical protein